MVAFKSAIVALAGVAAAIAVASVALAADLTPPPPPPQPSFTWDGPYGGVEAGFGWGLFRNGIVANSPGAVAGAFLGLNRQRTSTVFGLEADFMWDNLTDGGANAVNWETSIRGRLGFSMNHVLLFGTGGATMAGVTTTTPSASTEIGWTVGAGVDVGNDAVIGRLEYRYANYGTVLGAGTTTLVTHEVRGGVAIRF